MKADDRDSILRAGSAKKIARGLADKVDSLFHAAGHIEQQYQIERLGRGRDIHNLALAAVFVDGEVRVAHPGNSPTVAIGHAGVDTHQLRRNRSCQFARRPQFDQRRFAARRRQGPGKIAEHARADFANRVGERSIATANDRARGFSQRALAQIARRHGRIHVEQNHAALGGEIQLHQLLLFRWLFSIVRFSCSFIRRVFVAGAVSSFVRTRGCFFLVLLSICVGSQRAGN